MGYMHVGDCTLRPGLGGPSTPIVYFVDSPEHPFDLSQLSLGLRSNVVSIPVASWDDSLTPWPAEGVYREDDVCAAILKNLGGGRRTEC